MQLAPASREAVSLYAQSAAGMGNPGRAIAAWSQWMAAHPADAGAVTELGMLESANGDTARAMATYRKALQLDPNQSVAANNLAYMMVESGQDTDVALSLAQTARRSMPNAPNSADTLAWIYYYKGTYASARDLLEDALKAEPENAAMQYHLGMIYCRLNDKADAVLHLKRAAALAPHSTAARQAAAALTHIG
jgi:Flp pilus assembly protein TadD